MKKILAVTKNPISECPPFLNVMLMIAAYEGVEIKVICQSSPDLLKGHRSIEITELAPALPWVQLSRVQKIAYYMQFRKEVIDVYSHWVPDFFWIGTSDTAWMLIGMCRLPSVRHIVHNMELYDDDVVRYTLTKIASRSADMVVVCEINRAYFSKFMYKLEYMPAVLANRPIESLLNIQDAVGLDLDLLMEKIKGKFVVLYQGAIMLERVGFINVAKAVAELGDDWVFLCIGPDRMGIVERLQASFGNFIYAGNHAAPRHLAYTRLAGIGVASYADNCFNTIYCAPNKIWEYAAFCVPVLCSRLPSLVMSIENNNAGKCVNFDDLSEIKNALRQIRASHSIYKQAANKFYLNGGLEYKRVCESLFDLSDGN